MIIYLMFLFFNFLFSQGVEQNMDVVKQDELIKFYNDNYKKIDKENADKILGLLGKYTKVSYRDVFKMCKKQRKDCSYYKAKIMESEGSSGSAIELYLQSGYYEDYIRLNAVSGSYNKELIERYGINSVNAKYYEGLYFVSKGSWDLAIKIFSLPEFKNNAEAQFLLGYSYVMKGENTKAKRLIKGKVEGLSYFDKLEYDRLSALILYAENKQIEAMAMFEELISKIPNDYYSHTFLGQIYYRTGWFDKAEKIYYRLINNEWRDTELYYLLFERCEMRIRSHKFKLAKEDADRIIKEFPNRKDFLVELVVLLLEYGNINDALIYANKLSIKGDTYEKALHYLSIGLIHEYKNETSFALAMFKKATQEYSAPELKKKYDDYYTELNRKVTTKDSGKIDCGKYKVRKISEGIVLVDVNNYDELKTNYYIKTAQNTVIIPLDFKHSDKIALNEKTEQWINTIKEIWSVYGINIDVDTSRSNIEYNYVNVKINPWPSRFYTKRDSSHEWTVLTAPAVVAHEAGHLLGLEDEYYETDVKLSEKNEGRRIGQMGSIMRNMWSGKPEKRHIHFILSPLKCL